MLSPLGQTMLCQFAWVGCQAVDVLADEAGHQQRGGVIEHLREGPRAAAHVLALEPHHPLAAGVDAAEGQGVQLPAVGHGQHPRHRRRRQQRLDDTGHVRLRRQPRPRPDVVLRLGIVGRGLPVIAVEHRPGAEGERGRASHHPDAGHADDRGARRWQLVPIGEARAEGVADGHATSHRQRAHGTCRVALDGFLLHLGAAGVGPE